MVIKIKNFIHFKDYKTKKKIILNDEGVVISQKLAEKLNVKSEKISRWEALEKPRYSPTMVELQEWARITNRKLQWFISEEAPSQGVAPDTALLRLTEENRWFVNEMTTLLINHDVPGEALEATLRLLSTFPRSADAK